MANTSFAYVRTYEQPDPILPNVYILIRIDGKGFHRFSSSHSFVRPNDAPALELMHAAARQVMHEFRPEVVLAFGESDEYSFLLRRRCALYGRRASKLLTQVVSLFTSSYLMHWAAHMSSSSPLSSLSSTSSSAIVPSAARRSLGSLPAYPPIFDGRIVLYPTEREVIDYFAWRQADTHINNLYNTTFWALVQQGGQTEAEAHETLKGTVSAQKHEILHSRFGINYDSLPALFRKGTTLAWDVEAPGNEGSAASGGGSQGRDASAKDENQNVDGADGGERREQRSEGKRRARNVIRTLHVDIIGRGFWDEGGGGGGSGSGKSKDRKKGKGKGKGGDMRVGGTGSEEAERAEKDLRSGEQKGPSPVTATELQEATASLRLRDGKSGARATREADADSDGDGDGDGTATSLQPPWLAVDRLERYAGLGWRALQT